MKKTIELDSLAGCHISSVCKEAVAKATSSGRPVHFVFNGVDVTVQPGESESDVVARWDADREAAAKAWRESPERAIEAAKRAADELKARSAHMTESAQTEAEMRAAKVPWPLTKEQLTEYIDSLISRSHDYGTCCYAVSMAAVATFNYMSGVLGTTGFQSGCADLDILRRTRSMKGSFIILKAEDALYPQYDLHEKLAEALESWKPWLKEQAEKNLLEKEYAHENVIAHWSKLAKGGN